MSGSDPFLDDGDVRLVHADVVDGLRSLPAASVQTVVTSPPYWGLRDYGTAQWEGGGMECDHRHETEHQRQGATSQRAGRSNAESQRNENFREVCGRCGARRVDQQLGLEASPEEYVERLVSVFREVRRVLRDDGTVWLNLGDSYNAQPKGNTKPRSEQGNGAGRYHVDAGSSQAHWQEQGYRARGLVDGLKPKDLCMIPARVALALQADGWFLRAEVIWAKPSPMPESVTDRPTRSHEQVFLLSKRPRYFYDADAIRDPANPEGAHSRGNGPARPGIDVKGGNQAGSALFEPPAAGRNARSVWTIATQPFPEAHFATFPEELARRCILAGTSERGGCSACGAPWQRVVVRTPMVLDRSTRTHPMGRTRTSGTMIEPPTSTTTSWEPSCACGAPAQSQLVLDPFVGSGTTALVARKHARRCIGIDLSAEYLAIAVRRLSQLSLLSDPGAAGA